MTVSLIFSSNYTGSPVIALPQDAGTISPGASSSVVDIYIRRDGTNEITDVKFYLLPYSAGVYAGTDTAQDDYNKVIGWADASYGADPTSGGGIYINMNSSGSFPSADYESFRTGNGDSLANAITLNYRSLSVVADNGELPAGAYAHIRFRFDVPASETSAGTVYFDMLASYTATS